MSIVRSKGDFPHIFLNTYKIFLGVLHEFEKSAPLLATSVFRPLSTVWSSRAFGKSKKVQIFLLVYSQKWFPIEINQFLEILSRYFVCNKFYNPGDKNITNFWNCIIYENSQKWTVFATDINSTTKSSSVRHLSQLKVRTGTLPFTLQIHIIRQSICSGKCIQSIVVT